MCKKKTRRVDTYSEALELCGPCYHRATDENAVNDGEMTQAEFDAKYSKK